MNVHMQYNSEFSCMSKILRFHLTCVMNHLHSSLWSLCLFVNACCLPQITTLRKSMRASPQSRRPAMMLCRCRWVKLIITLRHRSQWKMVQSELYYMQLQNNHSRHYNKLESIQRAHKSTKYWHFKGKICLFVQNANYGHLNSSCCFSTYRPNTNKTWEGFHCILELGVGLHVRAE